MKQISDHMIRTEGHQIIPLCSVLETRTFFGSLGVSQIALEKPLFPFQTRFIKPGNHHLLFYILDGEYQFRTDAGQFPLPPGSLLKVHIDTNRQVSLISDQGTNVFMYVNPGKQWDPLFAQPFEISRCHYIDHLAKGVYGYLDSINSADFAKNKLTPLYANILRELLLEERHRDMPAAESINRQKINDIQKAISVEPERSWTVKDLAKMVSVSVPHLFNICRQYIDNSPMELVIQHRMNKACLLLQTTDDTIREIANAVGYKSEYSFSRLFLKHIGVRPNQYRNLEAASRDKNKERE